MLRIFFTILKSGKEGMNPLQFTMHYLHSNLVILPIAYYADTICTVNFSWINNSQQCFFFSWLRKLGKGFWVDMANESGQSGLGSTHAGSDQMGSGQKTGRPKWVAQPITLIQSFKSWIKTNRVDLYFYTWKNIYIKN